MDRPFLHTGETAHHATCDQVGDILRAQLHDRTDNPYTTGDDEHHATTDIITYKPGGDGADKGTGRHGRRDLPTVRPGIYWHGMREKRTPPCRFESGLSKYFRYWGAPIHALMELISNPKRAPPMVPKHARTESHPISWCAPPLLHGTGFITINIRDPIHCDGGCLQSPDRMDR